MKNVYSIFAFFSLLFCTGQLLSQNQWDARLVLNKLDCRAQQAWYTLEIKSSSGRDWALGDQNYRLFFDGDLMTVNSVRSLLPNNVYTAAQIDENFKLYGQGQEAYSPLDDIDDHLGFLDFSIVQKQKANVGASAMVSRSKFLPVAEIAMTIDAANLNSLELRNALNMKFSRAATAGKVTKQYVVITEHDAANHTRATRAGTFTDLAYERGPDAQLALICTRLPPKDLLQNRVLTRNKIDDLLHGDLEIYPNPATAIIHYQTPGLDLGDHEVLIYDQFNRLVYQLKQESIGNEENTLDLKDLPAGVYLLTIRTETVQLKKQLVKIVGH